MKAVAYFSSLPISQPEALVDVEMDKPVPAGRDLLVKIEAISVNPVDCKIRKNVDPQGQAKVLGWDAVGIVESIGAEVSLFKVGDAVYYAGDITRSGSNAEYQLIDERIVGFKPNTLTNAEAAALPLTSITAWEMLFDRLDINKPAHSKPVLLVVGGSGGVGSILIQLAKHLTQATVIATASRQESQDWVNQLGADYVVNHRQPLKAQIDALGLGEVTHVACTTHADQHFGTLIEVLKPQGKLGIIEFANSSVDLNLLKDKSISLHWEFMFTRAKFHTEDMIKQHHLLNRIGALIDEGTIQTTLGHHLGRINATNLRCAHELSESNKAIGKIVLEGF
ncbi:zinc-binding alcohol dehydrogenase family protein [Flavobacterium sp. W21_SRS_FM6]|uniref:zinc-binding alcohol dehydrogenase family protein n=1 Tax=Flavobacterium sp. W21_SRS_FM6 TaxID=3240268 RepID=UPI003F929AEE